VSYWSGLELSPPFQFFFLSLELGLTFLSLAAGDGFTRQLKCWLG
jgi:hypothetical protein